MDTFYSLNKLLSQLPFSILGYYEHEKEIDNFFVELCDSDFISQKNHIEVISYSYAKLTELKSWETKNLSPNFFFHSLNEKYSLLALNVYYSLRNNLFKRKDEELKSNPHLSNNVAIVLSRLFLKDVGFRLCYSSDENWHFSFYEQSNLFSIKIPVDRIIATKNKENSLTVFKNALSILLSDSIKEVDSNEKINNLLIQKKKGSKSTYFKFDTANSPISKPFNVFLKIFKPKAELVKLKNEFVEAIFFWHKTNPGYFTDVDTKEHIENWVELFFQIVFISLVYESWVEYFPSICGVRKANNEIEFRNLGGLILGYKISDEISAEERSLFRILSARISAVVAGQWTYENTEALILEGRRKEFKKLFDDFAKILDYDKDNPTGKRNRSHAVDTVDNDTLKLWKAKAVEYLEETKPFIAREDKFKTFLTNGEKTHQGLLLNVYPEKPNEIFLKSKSKFYESVSNSSYHSFKYDYIDFIFIEEFISLLKENKGGEQTGNALLIECKHEGNKQTGFKNKRLEITVDFLGDTQSHFSIDGFFGRLKTAHSSTGNYFTKFILSNFNLFRIHGDLEIVDATGISHFLLSRDAKLNSQDTKNPFIEIRKENIPIQSFDKLKFIIHIQHELK